jgi:hypothetical protein
VWHLSAEVKREGDIMEWILQPTWETLRVNPQLDGYLLKIFND